MKSGEGVQCVVAKRVDCSTSRERGEGGHHDSEVSFDGVVFMVRDRRGAEVPLDMRKLSSICHRWWWAPIMYSAVRGSRFVT